jgi:hypothetical protein
MNELIEMAESLRWAMEAVKTLQRGGRVPANTLAEVHAWGRLYRAEEGIKQFELDMAAEAERERLVEAWER